MAVGQAATRLRSAAGREQRRRTATARARTPALDRFYRYKLPPITPGDFEFNVSLMRPGLPAWPLDSLVESLTWNDDQSALSGSLTLHRPDPSRASSVPIMRGDRVRCRVRWDDAWFELWTMRAKPPQWQLDTNTGQVDLVDDMDLIDRSKRDWHFRETKHRRFGWFAHEIARLVARRSGFRLGNVAKGTVRITLDLTNASPLDVLKAAYLKEKTHSGRSFVIRMRNGAVDIVPLRRNPMLYVLAGQIQTAMLTQTDTTDTPATVLTGRGRVGKGHAQHKVSYTAFDRGVVDRFGYVHQTKDYGVVKSGAELRAKVKRDLAKMLKVTPSASVTHAGIPFVLRGDGVKLDLPHEGYSGAAAFVFVTTGTHNVQGQSYTTSWDFSGTDPYLAQIQADKAAAAKRAAKRKARKRRTKVGA